MNNSKIVVDQLSVQEPVDITPVIAERAVKLAKLIEALEAIKGSEYWQLLEREVFGKELEVLYRRIRVEKDPPALYRLQGEINQAEKYMNTEKLLNDYRLELSNIRKKING